MPVKPVQTITEWASDATWSIGPKVGELTKADYSGIAPQGHIPGTDNPSTGNEQNDYQNKMSLMGIWVMSGSSAKTLEAHVVEANAAGTAALASLDVGGTSSNQPPSIFGENSGTNAASIFASSGANDGIRSETTEKFGLVVRSRAQIGTSSFWAAEIDGTYNDGGNPAGKSGGLRILADNDELIAPVPPAQHPLNGRGLFVRNANGVAAEFAATAGFGTHSSNFAVIIGNNAVKGNGLRVNTEAGPEPIGGNGIETFGGRAFYDTVTSANSFRGGAGIIGRGGAADPAGDGLVDSPKSRSGAGVMGYAGIPRLGVLSSTNDAGPGIHGVSENIGPGVSLAGLFERVSPGIGAPGNIGAVVRIEAGKESTGIFGLEALSGHANAIRATSFGGTPLELRAQESDNVPGLFGAHLNFDNGLTDQNPSNPVRGDFWYRRTGHPLGSSHYLKFYTGSETRFIPHFRQPPIRQQAADSTIRTSLDNTDETTLLAFEFDVGSIPDKSIKVAFRLDFRFRFTTSTPAPLEPFPDACVIRLYDLTVGGGHIQDRFITYAPHTLADSANGPWDDFTITLIYTIPTGGDRDFEIRFLNQANPGGDPPTNQIKNVTLEVYAWDP